ncbi:hypothetical protein PMIN01_13551 [Paraphaeosphaeria minitans]|uniref:Uncharacterized protein n=1 Tax=Paraphaeosphaeria minitans TaxID=565426 RepID=A0A9P6G492_9PLEO|nr:hypothetical protein PMIN01_13551 [Paraphaeosphaeria minitans]
MVLVLLIGLLICFVCGFLLSVVFFLKDFSWLRKNRHSRFWERAVALLFSTCQGGFSIAGMVAVAIAFTTDTEPYRLDPVTLCTLQLFASANLTWTLRGIKDCRKAIWLVYGSIAWTAPDIAFFTRYETFPLFLCILLMTGRDNFAYEHALLTRVAIASTVSWGHWHEALQIHKDSGNPIPKRVHALLQFVIANAVAASFQIIGAVVLYGLSLVNVRISELRQGIVLLKHQPFAANSRASIAFIPRGDAPFAPCHADGWELYSAPRMVSAPDLLLQWHLPHLVERWVRGIELTGDRVSKSPGKLASSSVFRSLPIRVFVLALPGGNGIAHELQNTLDLVLWLCLSKPLAKRSSHT